MTCYCAGSPRFLSSGQSWNWWCSAQDLCLLTVRVGTCYLGMTAFRGCFTQTPGFWCFPDLSALSLVSPTS